MVQLIYQSTTTTIFCAEVCCCLSCQILCSVVTDTTQVVAYFPIGVASSRILHQPIDVVSLRFAILYNLFVLAALLFDENGLGDTT